MNTFLSYKQQMVNKLNGISSVGEARETKMKMLKSFAFGGINQIKFIQIYAVHIIL